jgi:hypothetical protein
MTSSSPPRQKVTLPVFGVLWNVRASQDWTLKMAPIPEEDTRPCGPHVRVAHLSGSAASQGFGHPLLHMAVHWQADMVNNNAGCFPLQPLAEAKPILESSQC